MDLYHMWFDADEGVRDLQIEEGVRGWLEHLRSDGKIEKWRLTRRKLGLAGDLPEWHVVVEVTGLAQLDQAFHVAARRSGEAEHLHHGINARVVNFKAALYRDFPDPIREQGGEAF